MPVPPHRPTLLSGLLGSMAASLLLGCGGGEPPRRAGVTIDTIDGVVHVANHGSGEWTRETAWAVREVFRLGGRAEPEEQLFSNQLLVADIGPHGNVHVLDHSASIISVFSRRGELVRTIGRPGRGPSDLSNPSGFTWSADGHLWVADPWNLKYVVYDTAGRLVRTLRRPRPVLLRRTYPLVHVEGVGIIDEASVEGNLGLLRVGVDGETRDTLTVVERDGPSRALVQASVETRSSALREVGRRYVSRTRWAVDPSGGIWTGSPRELRFVKQDWRGDTLRVVTADHRQSRLTPEDEELIAEAMRQTGLERSQIDPVRPLFQALHVIDGGYLLVQLVETPGVASSLFDVYHPEGRYLGELDLGFAPERQGNLGSRGDLVVAPMLGDLDVPYVVGVELVRSAGG